MLADKHALRTALSVEHARDIVFCLVSPEVHQSFTGQLGWTADQWERWINDNLAATILRRPPSLT